MADASQFVIYGPVSIETGSDVVGQTDGNLLVTVTLIEGLIPINTDAQGGLPEDYIQQASRAKVLISFQKYDPTLVNTLRGRLRVQATPAVAGVGVAGAVGLLARADRPATRNLILRGTKVTSRNGGKVITFPDVIRDPETDLGFENIGTKASVARLGLLAFPDGSGNVYTEASVT